jgi:tetratricopeptide (TPR) repeat protein
MPPKEVLPKAKEAATKALALDETLAEAHISMGAVKLFYEWNWSGAEHEANRAKELNPSYANAIELNTNYGDSHHFYCQYLDAVGRPDEAITEINRALELDPPSLMLGAELGWSYYNSRRYDQAITVCRNTLEKDPDFGFAYLPIGMSYTQKGMYREAIIELSKARTLLGHWPGVMAELGYAYAALGKRSEAQKILGELEQRAKREYVDPYYIALVYFGLGKKDQTFAWLEKGYDLQSTNLIWLKVEPKFERLRSDPRFTDLLRRVGLS